MASNSILQSKRFRNWAELPPELLEMILLRDEAFHVLMSARRVCKAWHRVGSDPALWRVLDLRCAGYRYGVDVETMARRAVDLSCGQSVDLSIAFWATDHVLLYISQRSSQLRRVHLVSCSNLTNVGLIQVVKNLPLLEELHLYHIDVSWHVIKAAGRHCPQLKSFKLNDQHKGTQNDLCNKEAQAVAKYMPGLRHLQLVANTMSLEGLLAIFKKCHHLETLDIRQCHNLKPLLLYHEADLLKCLAQCKKNLRITYDNLLAEESDKPIFSSLWPYL
ncbi:putative F-box/LRR-repeat protein 23 [Heracleum sosnowskyi]|uniref:F-box/LRR-repeat protein 23 n=1 Tax=Heracleum sosnowskyi TaxID=360622 RepID=A0AAD8M848_9APIA|nr:putative F-box/LRR-repeat protein 23 [Heracleum sosnowskyi]